MMIIKNNSIYTEFNTKLDVERDEIASELTYHLLTKEVDTIMLTLEEI